MPENSARSLDPEVLGESVGDDERPAEGYPADEPMGVEDDTIVAGGLIARDDVEGRDERLEPEVGEAGEAGGDVVVDERESIGLADTDPDAAGLDDEERLLADEVDPDSSPEAGALHVESAPDEA